MVKAVVVIGAAGAQYDTTVATFFVPLKLVCEGEGGIHRAAEEHRS